MDNQPNILVVDIETAPAELWGWGMYNQNFGVDQVKEPPYILCICAKWVGDNHVYQFSRWDDGAVGQLEKLIDLVKQADAIVSKNGVKFDIPWIRAELARFKTGLVFPMVTHIDLEKAAKLYFRFLSNKLEFIGQYLDEGGKNKTEFMLWRKVMEGDPYSQRRMLRYCARDVKLTERVYKRFRPHMENHPAIRAIGATGCPKCHSKNTKKDGFRYTACFRIQKHECKNCGGYFQTTRQKVA